MKSEDRETAIIVGIIMIVSIISLVAIFYFFWQIVGPGLASVINQLQYGVAVNQTNYNFSYPGFDEAAKYTQVTYGNKKAYKANNYLANKQRSEFIANFIGKSNYNFDYPGSRFTTSSALISLAGQKDQLLTAGQIAELANQPIVVETGLTVTIAKSGINSPITTGYDPDSALTQGFWLYPGSHQLGSGTSILLCYRHFYLPSDPRSCWYLDQLEKGDQIIVNKDGVVKAKYEVMNTAILTPDDPQLYEITSANVLQIVTAHPLGSDVRRFVVYAKLIPNS